MVVPGNLTQPQAFVSELTTVFLGSTTSAVLEGCSGAMHVGVLEVWDSL